MEDPGTFPSLSAPWGQSLNTDWILSLLCLQNKALLTRPQLAYGATAYHPARQHTALSPRLERPPLTAFSVLTVFVPEDPVRSNPCSSQKSSTFLPLYP